MCRIYKNGLQEHEREVIVTLTFGHQNQFNIESKLTVVQNLKELPFEGKCLLDITCKNLFMTTQKQVASSHGHHLRT